MPTNAGWEDALGESHSYGQWPVNTMSWGIMREVGLNFLVPVYTKDSKSVSFLQASDTPEVFKTSWWITLMEEESIWCFFSVHGWSSLPDCLLQPLHMYYHPGSGFKLFPGPQYLCWPALTQLWPWARFSSKFRMLPESSGPIHQSVYMLLWAVFHTLFPPNPMTQMCSVVHSVIRVFGIKKMTAGVIGVITIPSAWHWKGLLAWPMTAAYLASTHTIPEGSGGAAVLVSMASPHLSIPSSSDALSAVVTQKT